MSRKRDGRKGPVHSVEERIYLIRGVMSDATKNIELATNNSHSGEKIIRVIKNLLNLICDCLF